MSSEPSERGAISFLPLVPVSEPAAASTPVETQGVAMKECASFAPQSEAAAASSVDVRGPGEEVVLEQHIHIPDNTLTHFFSEPLLTFLSKYFLWPSYGSHYCYM